MLIIEADQSKKYERLPRLWYFLSDKRAHFPCSYLLKVEYLKISLSQIHRMEKSWLLLLHGSLRPHSRLLLFRAYRYFDHHFSRNDHAKHQTAFHHGFRITNFHDESFADH